MNITTTEYYVDLQQFLMEVRLEGPCTSVLRPSDGSLTLTLPESLSSTVVTTMHSLLPEFELAQGSGRIRQRGKYLKRPSDDRAKKMIERKS